MLYSGGSQRLRLVSFSSTPHGMACGMSAGGAQLYVGARNMTLQRSSVGLLGLLVPDPSMLVSQPGSYFQRHLGFSLFAVVLHR